MNLLSWNCRGLEYQRAEQFLMDLVSTKKHNIIFLCETLSGRDVVDMIKCRFCYQGCFCVKAQGHSGGLTLLWKQDSDIVL